MNQIFNIFKHLYIRASRVSVLALERAKVSEHLYMVLIAVVVGILGGFGAVLIKHLIELVSSISFPGDGSFLDNVRNQPWWLILIVPAIGGAIVGPLVHFFSPEARGHGVPEVMAAVLDKGGIIKPRVAIVKMLASAFTIGTGGSVGKEGPIIQIGASLGSTVGQFLRLPSRRMKTLVGCGAAAGIAAAFNAPIAGALFAIEIILMDFGVVQISPIVIASVTATVVSHSFEGNFAEFPVSQFRVVNPPLEMLFYSFLGLFCGLMSFLFIKSSESIENFWDKGVKVKPYIKPVFGGLMVGAIGIFAPEILGTGYETMNEAFSSGMLWYVAFGLVFVKMAASAITLGSGGSGGVFAPSLFIGAMAGVAFGSGMNFLFPQYSAEPGSYALVAMGGMIAGTMRSPITAIIMVFELTKENAVILPLMITVTIAMIISSRLHRESIYTLKLLHRNIQFKDRSETSLLKDIQVSQIMRTDFDFVLQRANFNHIVDRLIHSKIPTISVITDEGKFDGIITLNEIREYLFEKEELKDIVIAGDLAYSLVKCVTEKDNCRTVWDLFADDNLDIVPVISSNDSTKQIGVIFRNDLDELYNKEIRNIEMAGDLADKIARSKVENDIHFAEGYIISEIIAPPKFFNKSIKDLRIRNKYGVDILSIKCNANNTAENNFIPSPDYIIQDGDVLIIAGEVSKVTRLKSTF